MLTCPLLDQGQMERQKTECWTDALTDCSCSISTRPFPTLLPSNNTRCGLHPLGLLPTPPSRVFAARCRNKASPPPTAPATCRMVSPSVEHRVNAGAPSIWQSRATQPTPPLDDSMGPAMGLRRAPPLRQTKKFPSSTWANLANATRRSPPHAPAHVLST